MMRLLLFIFFLLPFPQGNMEESEPLPQFILKKIQKEVAKQYPASDDLETLVPALETEWTSPFLLKGRFFKINSDDTSLGYAFYGVAPSRTDTFDYLLILDKNFILKKSKILVYREDYGGEIASKRWLAQFYDQPLATQFKTGDNISGISGATISVRSMTQSINTVFDYIETHLISPTDAH